MSSLDIELHINGKPVTIGAPGRSIQTSADLGMRMITPRSYANARPQQGRLTLSIDIHGDYDDLAELANTVRDALPSSLRTTHMRWVKA